MSSGNHLAPPLHPCHGGILWKTIVLLASLLVIGTAYLLRKPLLTETAHLLLIVDEKLAPADAIIVLGDDNYHSDRARYAAKLYAERWAPRVVASGRYIRPYATISELIRRDVAQLGVPVEHVMPLAHSATNTREEATAVRRLVEEQRWRRIIVVTSNYHTRRSRFIFRQALPSDTELILSAAPDTNFDPQAWWQSRGSVKTFFREFFAWPVAWWEQWAQPADAKSPAVAPPAGARPR